MRALARDEDCSALRVRESAEVRERAVGLVLASEEAHGSQWATIPDAVLEDAAA
jgi:hypothetical protein